MNLHGVGDKDEDFPEGIIIRPPWGYIHALTRPFFEPMIEARRTIIKNNREKEIIMKSLFSVLLISVFLIAAAVGAQANTWYVDCDRPYSGAGTSWGTAKKTITDAIAVASADDEIWVKQGTYNISGSTSVNEAVHIYGGFAGWETARDQRNWKTQVTTVHQVSIGSCLEVLDDATIDGFTINNGSATKGGGIYCFSCAPTIRNCIFLGNTATSGGAINNDQSSSTIINCTFVNNDAGADGGGGIYNDDCAPTIINCIFAGNTADYYGGGMYNHIADAINQVAVLFL